MSTAEPSAEGSAPKAAALFAALGDETRLRLLARMSSQGPGSATALSARADVSRQAIHKHLEILEGVGLVRSARRGRERVWEINPTGLLDTHAWLDQVSAQWDEALERLRAFVEK